MQNTEQPQKGFTLLELVVSLSIVAVLVSLLLVAVHSARESARRTTCANRLRELGMATQIFVSAHQQVPSNGWGFKWIGQLERSVGPQQPGGWAFQLLPFLEISLPQCDTESCNAIRGQWLQLKMAHFTCPSRLGSELSAHTDEFVPVNSVAVENVAKTDFAICEGGFITATLGGPDDLRLGDSGQYPWPNVSAANGVSYQRSRVRLRDISDGLSQTYLIGEKRVSREHYFDGLDLGYDQSLLSGVDVDIARWVLDPPGSDASTGSYRQFGSAHSTTWQVVTCDGAVHQLSYDVDRTVHAQLGIRNDGEIATIPGGQ